jgi:hypothetical protein
MTEIFQTGINCNNAVRRDAPVVCANCGRKVARRMRGQRYCSQRCRQRTNRALKPFKNAPRYPSSGGATTPLKKDNKNNALQGAKTLSSPRILAPADVLAVEVFHRTWMPAVSSDGIAIEVSRLRARALV